MGGGDTTTVVDKLIESLQVLSFILTVKVVVEPALLVGLLIIASFTNEAGLQRYEVPPPAESGTILLFIQIVLLGEILKVGKVCIATFTESVLVQLLVPVTVTT